MTLADLDLNKMYTYADYFKWKFEERVELILGRIFEIAAPTTLHQKLSGNLYAKLLYFLEHQPCNVFIAPFDVRFPRRSKADKDIPTVLQPDICVVCDPSKIDSKGCLGAPDIVVEILSPGNNKKEMRNKYEVYEQNGVKEYWIVSPQDETFIVCTLHDGKYQASRPMVGGDIVTSSVLPGFALDLEALFKAMNK